MARGARAAVKSADVVHLHGNGLIIEVGQRLARRYGKPYIITLYGTDIWHHDPAKHARFAGVVRGARCRGPFRFRRKVRPPKRSSKPTSF